MKTLEALKVIEVLADGVNPFTGEVFAEDSPYQNPKVIRALHKAVEALRKTARNEKRRLNLPERAGMPWDDSESELLLKRFNAGVDISKVAKEHKRTTGAIRSQLLKLGKVPTSVSDKSTPTSAGQ